MSDSVSDTPNIIDRYIDCCMGSNGSHYDISLVSYEIIKKKFKYIEKNTWEYLENENWIIDENAIHLKDEIKSNVVNAFILRSMYWNNKANSEEYIDPNLSIDSKIKSLKILQFANKLKNEKFIIQLIKEIKQFY
jgi:hypothetical protein